MSRLSGEMPFREIGNRLDPIEDNIRMTTITTPVFLSLLLRIDEGGIIRIGSTQVTLIKIVDWYVLGRVPEEIHEIYPAVPFSHVYAVIAYYLENEDQVEAYIAEEERQDEKSRRKMNKWFRQKSSVYGEG